MTRHLLRLSDLGRDDLTQLVARARAHKQNPRLAPELLRGRSVTVYFNKPSTRTRLSFETAITRLGGLPITVGANDLQMGKSESIEDTARVMSRLTAAFVIRTFHDEDVRRLAAAATIPVINALTDGHHPCQAVADVMTIEEHLGPMAGKTVVYVGAGNNVTHSLAEACALTGAHLRVATPAAYSADTAVLAEAKTLAEAHGGTLVLTDDAKAAVEGADVVYTDTWLSMGDPPSEREERIARLAPYRVDAKLFARAKPTAIFMHCLPAHRGEEVTDEIADHARSVIFDQAENRLHTSVAILEALIGG